MTVKLSDRQAADWDLALRRPFFYMARTAVSFAGTMALLLLGADVLLPNWAPFGEAHILRVAIFSALLFAPGMLLVVRTVSRRARSVP